MRIKKEKKQNEEIKKQWEEIYNRKQLKSVTSNVDPMLKTTWGQGLGFNDSIPNQYPAGCTAVAMAQILRYWKCRVNPTGSLVWVYNGLYSYANFGATDYWWLNMNNNNADSYNAQLIYHAGVSCKTIYKPNAATSTPGKARDGFVDYWGMSESADVKWRIWHLSNWKNMLLDELHAGRPILYSAGGVEIGDDWIYGHSWVIDGVTVDHNYFWCNWGWYGIHNGWFELGNFEPNDHNFNQIESAIFNVYPAQSSGVETPKLTNKTFNYSANGYNLTIPEAFGATSYEWITDNGTISGNGTSVTLFTQKTASVMIRAYNEICNIYSPYKIATITINYGPISGPSIICPSGSSFTVDNLPSGFTIEWSQSNNINRDSAQGANPCTFSANGNGEGWIEAKIKAPNGNIVTILPRKTIWVGVPRTYITQIGGAWGTGSPPIPDDSGSLMLDLYAYASYDNYIYFDAEGRGDNESWDIQENSPAFDLIHVNNHIIVVPQQEGGGFFKVRINNECGKGSWVFCTVIITDMYNMLISPNPTTGETTISLTSNDTKQPLSNDIEWEMEIYDWSKSLRIKQPKIRGSQYKFNTANLLTGVYTVRVKIGDQVLCQCLK